MIRKSCCVATPATELYTVTVKYSWSRTREHHRGICAACVAELMTERGAGVVSARPFIQEWMTRDLRAEAVPA